MTMDTIHAFHVFDALRDQLCGRVATDRTIPDQVFLDRHWPSRFCQFDLCFSPQLLHSCVALCETTGDTSLSFVMLDPDPVEYYFREFGRFGAVTMQVHEDVDAAWSAFEEDPGGSPADALMYAVRKFAVISPSLRWAVWGSRDEDVIIVGAENNDIVDAFSCNGCCVRDVDDALDAFLRRDDHFNELLRANYNNKSQA